MTWRSRQSRSLCVNRFRANRGMRGWGKVVAELFDAARFAS